MLEQQIASYLQRRDGLFTLDRGEVVEKALQAITRREVVEQILDWHSGTDEDRRAAQDLWVNPDDRGESRHRASMVPEWGRDAQQPAIAEAASAILRPRGRNGTLGYRPA